MTPSWSWTQTPVLAPTFLAEAVRRLRDGVGGVGGVFTGRSGGGFVGMLQRNEYARYARDVARLKGKVLVLTGTATLFSARTLRHVVWARAEGLLPGGSAQVYDTNVLTEDNELTLALLHLGYQVHLAEGLPPHDRGDDDVARPLPAAPALEARRDRKSPRLRVDARDCAGTGAGSSFTFAGIVVTLAYLSTLGWSLAVDGSIDPRPLWLAVTGIFVVERVVTVRARGPVQMVLAATLLVEMTLRLLPPGNPSTKPSSMLSSTTKGSGDVRQ